MNKLLHYAGPEHIHQRIYSHFEFIGDKNKDCKMSVMHKFKELYQGAKNVIYRKTGVMIVSCEEFFQMNCEANC